MKEQLSSLEKFLLWSSGADHRILAQKECLTERYKYSAIGTTVLLTATMAFASGGYALFTVFASLPASIVGGGFWGLTIFNLDRFFILSSKRKKTDSKSAFYAATALRLLIALLLSFVVAKPLELRLFENEINRELREEQIVDANKRVAEEKTSLGNVEQKIAEFQQEKTELSNARREAEQAVISEAEGTAGSGYRGKGDVYEDKKGIVDSLNQDIAQIDNEITQLQTERNELRQTIEDTLESENNSNESDLEAGSFLARLVALEKLAEEDSTIAAINRLITILFIIIETSPVLVKTLSGRGSYDDLLEQQNDEVPKAYLSDRQQEQLQQVVASLDERLKSIMDFEQEVAKRKEKYLKAKERSKANIDNNNLKNIRLDIDRQHDREILRFFDFCDREVQNYLNKISDEIKEHPKVVRGMNHKIASSMKSDRTIQHKGT